MHEITLMLRSALPIYEVDRFMSGPTDSLAIVWVDITERPDLNILAARHKQESGYCIFTWFYGNPGKQNMFVGLRADMRQPTRTVFHLIFNVERFIDQLSLVAQTGKIWIVPGPPPDYGIGASPMTVQDILQKVASFAGQGVALELEPLLTVGLRDMLDQWLQRKA